MKSAREYSVSEIAHALKRTIEDAYGHVRVRGEVSGYKGPHSSSGHCYFCLKDEGAKLDAVVWRTSLARLKNRLQEGLEVIATGKLSAYPGKSTYQIVIEALEPAGIGALMAQFERLKEKLGSEGLFAAERKAALPYLPRVIGIITSPTGAVIRDILHRLKHRFPRHVLVWPVRVQGETCPAEVAAAIAGFNGLGAKGGPPRPDLIIVARGGGSLEDLWGFNDEMVVRAAAASAIPLIAAIGHETDWTLIDFAADERAPTPSAAAERAVPVRLDLLERLGVVGARLERGFSRLQGERRARLLSAARALPRPDDVLALARQRCDGIAGRLNQALRGNTQSHRAGLSLAAAKLSAQPIRQQIARCRQALDRFDRQAARSLRRVRAERARQLGAASKLLASLSHESVLQRGYALVRDRADRLLNSARQVRPGMGLSVEFRDGRAGARADGSPRRHPGAGADGQGLLFETIDLALRPALRQP